MVKANSDETMIPLKKSTRKILKDTAKKSETYDDIILRLLGSKNNAN